MAKLEFLNNIKLDKDDQKKVIKSFDDYMLTIFDALGINNFELLKSEIDQKFNDANRFQIISNPNIQAALQGLVKSDSEIKMLKNLYSSFFTKIEKEWNEMTTNLGKLQTFILLKQVKPNDCSKFIKKLGDALNNKINFVNEILEQNIMNETAEIVNKSNKNKYIKYKNKYLNLKKHLK